MSLRAMLWALHEAPTSDPQSALVLIALAENARDDGTAAWPSVATIASKARCSERTAHRRLKELQAAGLICRGDQRMVGHLDSRYRPVVYDLCLHAVRGDSVAGLAGSGVTAGSSRGDSGGHPGVTPVADKPSYEPSLEPTTSPLAPQGGEQPALVVAPAAAAAPAKARRSRFPDGFEPTDAHRTLAADLGVDLAAELEQFRDHHQAKGSTFVDWNKALNTWLRNAAKWRGPKAGAHRSAGQYASTDPGGVMTADEWEKEGRRDG